jgi:nitroreductase
MGFAAQWLTEWYAYDETIDAKLGLKSGERVAGFVYIGSATAKPDERQRPDLQQRIQHWTES